MDENSSLRIPLNTCKWVLQLHLVMEFERPTQYVLIFKVEQNFCLLERYGSDGSKKVNLTLCFQTGEFQPISPPLEALILLGYLLENFANPCCLLRNRIGPITSNPHEKQRKSVVFLSSNVYSLTLVIKTHHRFSFKAVYFSPSLGVYLADVAKHCKGFLQAIKPVLPPRSMSCISFIFSEVASTCLGGAPSACRSHSSE